MATLMMAKFNHTSLVTFRSALIKALDSDPTVINFWPVTELNTIIQEALLTFGSLNGFWKKSILINTEEAKRIYDIFTDFENTDNITPSLTYGDVINWLNIDLIEAISEDEPTSSLFTLSELLDSIESKYNLFQLETNLINSKVELIVKAQNNLVRLPDDVLDVVRVVYKYVLDEVNYETVVHREDDETISQFDSEAVIERGTPIYYSTIYGSSNELFLYPTPTLTGTLEVIYVNAQDKTSAITVDTTIDLPNNLVIYLKYAVLGDIFNKDGLLNDPARATYCNKRWAQGLAIGKNYTSILTVKSNGLAIATDSINKLDDYTDILEASSDAPTVLGLAGFNIFEIDNLPDLTVNSILLNCLDNAPLPVEDLDMIDVEIGYIDPILNYCLHLCQFKCGANGLALTNNYLEEFIKIGISHNQRLANRGIGYELLMGKTKLEERQLPRLVQQPSTSA